MIEERPTEEQAKQAVTNFLKAEYGGQFDLLPEPSLVEDGESGWAFWVLDDDTTSYVHHDLLIEWCGSAWEHDLAEGLSHD